MQKRIRDASYVRSHISSHESFFPSEEWLLLTDSRMCPTCAIVCIGKRQICCSACKQFQVSKPSARVPRAQHLPKLQRNHFDQLSLGSTSAAVNAGLPPAELVAHDLSEPCELNAPDEPCELNAPDEDAVPLSEAFFVVDGVELVVPRQYPPEPSAPSQSVVPVIEHPCSSRIPFRPYCHLQTPFRSTSISLDPGSYWFFRPRGLCPP